MAVIKPFSGSQKAVRRGPASTTYVERRLHEVLSSFGIEGDGLEVGQTGDGKQISIRWKDRGAEHPFKVTGSGGGVIVSPGVVRTLNNSGGLTQWEPRIGGQPLSAKPTLTVGLNGWVVLRMIFDPATGFAQGTPWSIVFVSSLSEGAFRRSLGDDLGTSDPLDFALAKIVGGAVETPQLVRANIQAMTYWNRVMISFMP